MRQHKKKNLKQNCLPTFLQKIKTLKRLEASLKKKKINQTKQDDEQMFEKCVLRQAYMEPSVAGLLI